MHYYSHHIGDFIRDTSRLTDSQAMAYLRMIWLYYESEQPLPNNPELLAFKIGSDVKTVEMLLQCYFYANALHWHHKRIDAEIEAFKIKSKKAADSAKARWKNAKDMRTHSECNASAMLTNNQEPITNNQEKEKEKKQPQAKPAESENCRFEEFWQAYPPTDRRTAKKQCFEKWKKKRLDEQADLILLHIDAMRKTTQWRQGYEPSTLTYINQERWIGFDGGGMQVVIDRQQTQSSTIAKKSIYEQNMEAAARAKIMLFGSGDETD